MRCYKKILHRCIDYRENPKSRGFYSAPPLLTTEHCSSCSGGDQFGLLSTESIVQGKQWQDRSAVALQTFLPCFKLTESYLLDVFAITFSDKMKKGDIFLMATRDPAEIKSKCFEQGKKVCKATALRSCHCFPCAMLSVLSRPNWSPQEKRATVLSC